MDALYFTQQDFGANEFFHEETCTNLGMLLRRGFRLGLVQFRGVLMGEVKNVESVDLGTEGAEKILMMI